MKVQFFTVGPFAENTYLITNAGKALIIDPGFTSVTEFRALTEAMDEEDCEPIAVVLTHAHVDHVLGLNQVLQRYDIPVWLNHSDLFLWENFEGQAARFGVQTSGFDFLPNNLEEQDGMEIGPFLFDVLYTPGHSPDHVSLHFKEAGFVIAGDVLFRESIGRTDLYKGSFDLLAQSIRTKLYTLDDDLKVYPGHGPATTIGYEKRNNPFVNDK